LVALLALSAGVFLTDLGSPLGLHQNDEDFYLGVARAMHDSGDWVVPTWGGQPTFVKPPLLYWLMAASMRIFGSSLTAARLPVAVLAVLTVYLTYAFARRIVGSEAAGLWAGFLTATTVGFLQYGRVAMMDVPLALGLLAATWAVWRIGQGSGVACYAFFATVAGSVLLKGPATALVPLGGAVLWLALGRRAQANAPALPWLHVAGGAALGAALVGAWPLALYTRGAAGPFYHEFILGENLGKFAGARNPLLGMLSGFAALLLPWTLVVLTSLWLYAMSSRRRDAAAILPLSFIAMNILVYALPAIKWPQYLLPSIPLVAVFVSWATVAPSMALAQAHDEAPGDAVAVLMPFNVLRPLKIACLVTGSVLLVVSPVLSIGARLFSQWGDRLLLFALAAALAFTALCLLSGPRLIGAAAAFAVALIVVNMLTPVLSLERLPQDVSPLVAGRELMTYGVPPYGYQLMLGRAVGVTDQPRVFHDDFQRGVLFIVGDSETRQLVQDGALDMQHARVVACWRKWRRHMNAGWILRVVFAGTLDDLTENVCLIERVP